MSWRDHSNLKGTHAFMSPSQPHWLKDNAEQFKNRYINHKASLLGTKFHEHAANCIELGTRMPRNKATFNNYVNDAIGFRMSPEQVLYFSDNCFGTADAILFQNGKLRIHDLKTGVTPAHMTQLLVYAALYCLEHDIRPGDIETELRIYQNNDIAVMNPDATDIAPIMDQIVTKSRWIDQWTSEGI